MAAKRRGHTISLKGVAAKAFVEMYTGVRAPCEDDVFVRLATLVHMEVASNNMDGAVALLKDAMAQARVDARKDYNQVTEQEHKECHETLPKT